MAEEACKTRPLLCATLLAYWQAMQPDSPAPGQKEAALMKLTPFRTHVSPGRLGTLIWFYQGDAADAELTPEQARSLTDTFADYYHHGAGFPRDMLRRIWARCRDEGGGCETMRERAERRVGPIPVTERAAGG